jgi:hypothetical protein
LIADRHLASRVIAAIDVTARGEIIAADADGRLADLVVDPVQ